MPKRKRSVADDVDEVFDNYREELFKVLRVAKGHERQRLAKRMKDVNIGRPKLRRLEDEVSVLKSLDLQQTAHAHLCSAVLKVKAAANSSHLPERIKSGIAKPNLSEEERALLHNVTSALYQRKEVRGVVDKAIPAICQALGVPPSGSGKAKGDQEEKPAPQTSKREKESGAANSSNGGKQASSKEEASRAANEVDDNSESDLDDESEGSDDELDERAISKMEAMLGSSSSESEDDDDYDVQRKEHSDPASKAPRDFEDDISLPGSDSEPEAEQNDLSLPGSDSESEEPEEEDGDQSEDEDELEFHSFSPEPDAPSPLKKKEKKPSKGTTAPAKAVNSTFLPSLMGGYISGSESASDVDAAPPPRKNRRGQKARQAIWEKKYGDKAKHLSKETQEKKKRRDAGWDAKRGAVEAGAEGKPWKKGVRNPLQKRDSAVDRDGDDRKQSQAHDKGKVKGKENKRDDTGPLHPSWEARKKAKQNEANATFQGKKIVFD